MLKPRIFVGSSKEALGYARALRLKLKDIASVSVWDKVVSDPGKATLEKLIELLPEYDFAVLVMNADDVTTSRRSTKRAPRDNVVFELGLFMGHLGRFRTFFLCSGGERELKLPSDLKGITYIPFQPKRDKGAAISDACKTIRRAVKHRGALKLFESPAIIERIRMSTWKDIYERATRMVMLAEARVKATSFGMPTRLHGAKLTYFKAIAKRAAEKKKNSADFMYKVVCSKKRNNRSRDRALLDRKRIFRQYGVFDSLHAREIEGNWRVDFLIVDDKHLHVSFQRIFDHSLGLGLEIMDAPELVSRISSWFDECLFDQAKPINWNSIGKP